MPIAAVNGTELYYETTGRGEPLLLIPGLGMGADYFQYAIPYLAASCRVISLDLRGIGRSAKPDERYSVETWADDVAALLEYLGESSAHIVGASLGGCIAMALVDRHRSRVKSMELIAAFSDLDYALELNWRLRKTIVTESGMGAAIQDHVTLWTLGHRFLETERGQHVAGQIRRGISSNDPKMYLAFLEAILDFGCVTPATAGRSTYTERLRDVRVPTLLVAGAQDILTPPVLSERVAAAMPPGCAEVAIIPDSGHITMVEVPEENSRLIIDFVQRVVTSSEDFAGQ